MKLIPDQPIAGRNSAQTRRAGILIIDDDKEGAEELASFLGRFGFQATVSRPINAHDAARSEQPDLILLDLCLDGPMILDTRSSEHLLKCLKADEATRRIPVIAMSGLFSDPKTEARFKGLGAEAFYTKGEVLSRGSFLRSLQARLLQAELVGTPAEPASAPESETGASREDFPCELTILVIDDEEDTSELLGFLFKNRPYRILWAKSGAHGLGFAATELPDLVVLDLRMPGLDGQEVCRRLRESQSGFRLPILMLTGESRVVEQVRSIDLGADDYLLKGSPNLLLEARIQSLIRRVRLSADSSWIIRRHGAVLDARRHELSISGRRKPVVLTKTEGAIMAFLMSAAGSPVEAAAIHKKVCGSWKPHAATIKVHISNMRGKLGPHADLIEAISGEGSYRFNVELAKRLEARFTN